MLVVVACAAAAMDFPWIGSQLVSLLIRLVFLVLQEKPRWRQPGPGRGWAGVFNLHHAAYQPRRRRATTTTGLATSLPAQYKAPLAHSFPSAQAVCYSALFLLASPSAPEGEGPDLLASLRSRLSVRALHARCSLICAAGPERRHFYL